MYSESDFAEWTIIPTFNQQMDTKKKEKNMKKKEISRNEKITYKMNYFDKNENIDWSCMEAKEKFVGKTSVVQMRLYLLMLQNI